MDLALNNLQCLICHKTKPPRENGNDANSTEMSIWLGWVVLHINLYRLFNAKSIFMKIVLFQTIQFSISTQFKYKYSLIVKNISISSYSV